MPELVKEGWLSEHLTIADAEGIFKKFGTDHPFLGAPLNLRVIAYAYELGYQEGYTARTEGK